MQWKRARCPDPFGAGHLGQRSDISQARARAWGLRTQPAEDRGSTLGSLLEDGNEGALSERLES